MEHENKSIEEKVSQAIIQAYEETAEILVVEPDELPTLPNCEQVSRALADILINQYSIKANVATYLGWDITSHEFVVIPSESDISDDDIIIDPTYRQFLENNNSEGPKYIFTQRKNLTHKLDDLDIPKELHHIWLKAITRVE